MQSARGIGGLIDFVVIRRDDGLLSKISFKSAEQGRAALQAEPVNLVAIDELLSEMDVFTELQARTTATSGVIRDSPDGSRTGVDTRVLRGFQQDRSAVRAATVNSGSPNGGRGADLTIFAGIWTHSSRR